MNPSRSKGLAQWSMEFKEDTSQQFYYPNEWCLTVIVAGILDTSQLFCYPKEWPITVIVQIDNRKEAKWRSLSRVRKHFERDPPKNDPMYSGPFLMQWVASGMNISSSVGLPHHRNLLLRHICRAPSISLRMVINDCTLRHNCLDRNHLDGNKSAWTLEHGKEAGEGKVSPFARKFGAQPRSPKGRV